MADTFIELSSQDPDPGLACDRGVVPVPAADRLAYLPDCTLLLTDRESLVARCSCWWSATAEHDGRRIGVIGHYAASDERRGAALLTRACGLLASKRCATAVGPMDGNTWRRYRFIVERGDEPPFFLEPDNPDDWPAHWTRAGFVPVATYTSAINDDLSREDPRTGTARARLAEAGIHIRTFEGSVAGVELRRIFALSLAAFSRNFLYTPISEAEFLAQYDTLLPYVRPELVLLAEQGETLVGFLLAMPDVLQARRSGYADTVILKTLAVDPSVGGIGLGGALLDLAQRSGRELGFRRAVHALIHETNVSRRISSHYARTFRRYALFSRPLSV